MFAIRGYDWSQTRYIAPLPLPAERGFRQSGRRRFIVPTWSCATSPSQPYLSLSTAVGAGAREHYGDRSWLRAANSNSGATSSCASSSDQATRHGLLLMLPIGPAPSETYQLPPDAPEPGTSLPAVAGLWRRRSSDLTQRAQALACVSTRPKMSKRFVGSRTSTLSTSTTQSSSWEMTKSQLYTITSPRLKSLLRFKGGLLIHFH